MFDSGEDATGHGRVARPGCLLRHIRVRAHQPRGSGHRAEVDVPLQRCASDTRTVRVADGGPALSGLLAVAAASGWSLLAVVRHAGDLWVELAR